MQPRITAVVFDLGGVLIDWDPRYLYRTLFDDEAAMEEFLATVTTQEWNRAQDAGRPWAEAVEELADASPRAARPDRGVLAALAGDARRRDRADRRAARRAAIDRHPAVRAQQLVGRDVPARPAALPVPRVVRRHRDLRRRAAWPSPIRGSSRSCSSATGSSAAETLFIDDHAAERRGRGRAGLHGHPVRRRDRPPGRPRTPRPPAGQAAEAIRQAGLTASPSSPTAIASSITSSIACGSFATAKPWTIARRRPRSA